MKTADDYLRAVIACLPPAGPTRARFEMDLRAINGERVESGRPLDEISFKKKIIHLLMMNPQYFLLIGMPKQPFRHPGTGR